ncbi:MAG: hypothetical protein HC848_04585 [Limnobacter sp.]|nr:hypothetical protein [Limnobacter sp.]
MENRHVGFTVASLAVAKRGLAALEGMIAGGFGGFVLAEALLYARAPAAGFPRRAHLSPIAALAVGTGGVVGKMLLEPRIHSGEKSLVRVVTTPLPMLFSASDNVSFNATQPYSDYDDWIACELNPTPSQFSNEQVSEDASMVCGKQ